MSKFQVNDRVAIEDNCVYFKNLRGLRGTVVNVLEATEFSATMIDVKVDNRPKLTTVPFFEHEIRLIKRVNA